MATAEAPLDVRTIGELIRRLGDIPPDRIRFSPVPGTATVADAEANECELIDGVLVEKPMGLPESLFAAWVIHLLQGFIIPRNLGLVSGEQGMMELLTGLVRIPDVAFLSWDRLPGRRAPGESVPAVVPDLAVEVLSPGNTPAEMARKRREYFAAGVRLVWMIDLPPRTVTVYTAVDQLRLLTAADVLDGGDVLPGFAVAVRELFAELDRRG